MPRKLKRKGTLSSTTYQGLNVNPVEIGSYLYYAVERKSDSLPCVLKVEKSSMTIDAVHVGTDSAEALLTDGTHIYFICSGLSVNVHITKLDTDLSVIDTWTGTHQADLYNLFVLYEGHIYVTYDTVAANAAVTVDKVATSSMTTVDTFTGNAYQLENVTGVVQPNQVQVADTTGFVVGALAWLHADGSVLESNVISEIGAGTITMKFNFKSAYSSIGSIRQKETNYNFLYHTAGAGVFQYGGYIYVGVDRGLIKVDPSTMTRVAVAPVQTTTSVYDYKGLVSDGTYLYLRGIDSSTKDFIVKIGIADMDELAQWTAPVGTYPAEHELQLAEGYLYQGIFSNSVGLYQIDPDTMTTVDSWGSNQPVAGVSYRGAFPIVVLYLDPVEVHIISPVTMTSVGSLTGAAANEDFGNRIYREDNGQFFDITLDTSSTDLVTLRLKFWMLWGNVNTDQLIFQHAERMR